MKTDTVFLGLCGFELMISLLSGYSIAQIQGLTGALILVGLLGSIQVQMIKHSRRSKGFNLKAVLYFSLACSAVNLVICAMVLPVWVACCYALLLISVPIYHGNGFRLAHRAF